MEQTGKRISACNYGDYYARSQVSVAYASPDGKLSRLVLSCETVGRLAVHPVLFSPASGWSVTHVLTGFCIASFPSLDAARRFRRELLCLDWEFRDPDDIPQSTRQGVIAAFSRRGVSYSPPREPAPAPGYACPLRFD
jgi:hypothetical protein